MVHFVGAGCGAPDLITLRGRSLLEEADVIVYAGSVVNPALLGFAKKDCRIYNSAQMTLEEVIAVMEEAEKAFEHIAEMQAALERMNQELADRTDYESESYHALF